MELGSLFNAWLYVNIHLGVFAGDFCKLLNFIGLSVILWLYMAEAQQDEASESAATNFLPADLGAILEAQKNAIISAVSSQIHNLQSSLLSAQADLSTQIVSEGISLLDNRQKSY